MNVISRARLLLFGPAFAGVIFVGGLNAAAIENAIYPILTQDRIANLHFANGALCWDSSVFKNRDADPRSVSWTILVTDTNNRVGVYSDAPRRVKGPQSPRANIVNLPPGHTYETGWCYDLPLGLVVARVQIGSVWTYKLPRRFYSIPVPRVEVDWDAPPAF